MSNDPKPHNLAIATEIRRMIRAGVAITVIFDKIKDMKDAPRSYTTFYKIYRSDIADARANLHEAVGSLIMSKAVVDQDWRALEFVARTKMGWSEKVVVQEADDTNPDESTSAIDDLIAALNLKKKDKPVE